MGSKTFLILREYADVRLRLPSIPEAETEFTPSESTSSYYSDARCSYHDCHRQ